MREKASLVLVHGGFVDGSGWRGIYDHLLTADGYGVSIVQNPTLSLEGDAARSDGPTGNRRSPFHVALRPQQPYAPA
jgi:hypothetical protein